MIPVADPKRTAAAQRDRIVHALSRVVDSGWYILGKEVSRFEEEFAGYVGLPHAVAVGSGTDALTLALMAGGLASGEGVILPANSAFPTACAVTRAGCVPVFVDVNEATATIDPARIQAVLEKKGPCPVDLKIRGIIPVHLYGHSCDMAPILDIARRYGLFVLEDCAQSHGTRYDGQMVGTFGAAAAFSFYPTKNLAALGDAGMVVTADKKTADRLRSVRDYGQRERYIHEDLGMNSRMDDIQAAVLSLRLADLEAGNERRRAIAQRYRESIRGPYRLPIEEPNVRHVYHLFVIRSTQRQRLMDHLTKNGIGYAMHYPNPIHLQPVYRSLGYRPGDIPVTERLSGEILSIPMFPELTDDEVGRVIDVLNDFS